MTIRRLREVTNHPDSVQSYVIVLGGERVPRFRGNEYQVNVRQTTEASGEAARNVSVCRLPARDTFACASEVTTRAIGRY